MVGLSWDRAIFIIAEFAEKIRSVGLPLVTVGLSDHASPELARLSDRFHWAGIAKVAFDRSGFMYHGRVKALAEAAREAGLEF